MQILKLGGSVITDKGKPLVANHDAIEKLAKAIARVWHSGIKNLVLVHGAGSFGHPLVIKYGIENGATTDEQKIACKKTHEACRKLSSYVVDALLKNGVDAVSLSPDELIMQENKRIFSFNTSAIFAHLDSGSLPILHGDIVPDEALGHSVCSGDQIVAYLGRNADRVVFGTNVDGIIVDGKPVPLITNDNWKEIESHLHGSGSPDVTGGMAGKVSEIMKIGKPVFIANANFPERIEALLRGEKAICTEIRI